MANIKQVLCIILLILSYGFGNLTLTNPTPMFPKLYESKSEKTYQGIVIGSGLTLFTVVALLILSSNSNMSKERPR